MESNFQQTPNISKLPVITTGVICLILGILLTLTFIYFSPNTFKSFLGLKETVYVDREVDEKDSEENLVIDDSKPTKVAVYMFDRKKYDTANSTLWVTKVDRETTRKDVATFSIEEVIKGPSSIELKLGLEPTFSKTKFVYFVGSSNCNGKDFKISITNGKATLQFCKQTMLSGDMSGSVISQQIVNTLKQFSTIKQVRILNYSGTCFNDLSGRDTTECYE